MEGSIKPTRKQLRLRTYDYSAAGLYFVTICTHARRCLFGEAHADAMCLNSVGTRVAGEWSNLSSCYPSIVLHEFVVMPNHLHGVIELMPAGWIAQTGAMNRAPTDNVSIHNGSVGAQFIAPSVALGDVVRGFKARCTTALRKEFGFAEPVWQRNYHEHVIRNESSLRSIREYIQNNPAQWALDRENPEFAGR